MEPKKNFIRILGVSCGIVIVLGGILWYVKADIDKHLETTKTLRTDVTNIENALSALASLQGDAETANNYLAQIDRMLITKDQLLTFSTDISFLAQQAGFTGSPKFGEDTAPQTGELHKTNFSLFLEGDKGVGDLGNFLKLVEQSKYYVRFNSIDLVRDGAAMRVTLGGYVVSF